MDGEDLEALELAFPEFEADISIIVDCLRRNRRREDAAAESEAQTCSLSSDSGLESVQEEDELPPSETTDIFMLFAIRFFLTQLDLKIPASVSLCIDLSNCMSFLWFGT